MDPSLTLQVGSEPKADGKWWLIDLEGHSFSVGTCLTGWRAETSAVKKRVEKDFFSYLPKGNDYLKRMACEKLVAGFRDFKLKLPEVFWCGMATYRKQRNP